MQKKSLQQNPPILSETAHSVMQNIDNYWEGAHDTPDLIEHASSVKQWKCYEDNDGNWRFGPSRFVGYEDMTPEEYVERRKTNEGGLNGTETENNFKLHEWHTSLTDDSKLHSMLKDLVSKFLSKSDKKLNTSPQFAIISLDDEDLNIQDKNGAIPLEVATDAVDLEEAESAEGKRVLQRHWKRERDPTIVKTKKEQFLKKHGRLFCEVCGFDYGAKYGDRGAGYIECHHTVPVSEMKPGYKTKLPDLALVCANCHRMIHTKGPLLSIEDLARLLRNPK